MVRLPKPMRREFWFVRNLVQVNLTCRCCDLGGQAEGQSRERKQRLQHHPHLTLRREGARRNLARFHDCVGDEEGAASQRALSPCRWLQTYRHRRKPSAALHATAGLQHIRTVPDLISQVYAVHECCIARCPEDKFPISRPVFGATRDTFQVWSSVGAWKMDPATLIAGQLPLQGG